MACGRGVGRQTARVLHDRCEGRRLNEVELAGIDAVVGLGRSLDAVGAAPEVDLVEVGGKDGVLGVLFRPRPGDAHLFKLTRVRPVFGILTA